MRSHAKPWFRDPRFAATARLYGKLPEYEVSGPFTFGPDGQMWRDDSWWDSEAGRQQLLGTWLPLYPTIDVALPGSPVTVRTSLPMPPRRRR